MRQDNRMQRPSQCRHRNRKVIKYYRRNYPYGKKSKVRFYDPPKLCKEICLDCGEELNRWKPVWTKK